MKRYNYPIELLIRHAKKSDLPAYTKMHQKVYQAVLVNEAIGLTKECLSEKVFNSIRIQKYLTSNLVVNSKQKCWLAFDGKELVGSITIIEREKDYELRGFYVAINYQGKGIGKKLWKLALDFAKNKDIVLDIYAHNTKSIEMYKKWGLKIDKEKGEFYRHWPEWPENVKAKSIYMKLRK
jgi:ribosomal protein S18 acetylase RimI-like enzyme